MDILLKDASLVNNLLIKHKGRCDNANAEFLKTYPFENDKHALCQFCTRHRIDKKGCKNSDDMRYEYAVQWISKNTSLYEED